MDVFAWAVDLANRHIGRKTLRHQDSWAIGSGAELSVGQGHFGISAELSGHGHQTPWHQDISVLVLSSYYLP